MLALWSLFILLYAASFSLCQDVPTTPHFPEVFLGKCFNKNPVGVDCYALFGNFSNAAMTDNAILTNTSYDPFFSLANFSSPNSSILFWSGSQAFAQAISSNDPRFVTVEETSTGYIINNMSWCGTPNHTFDYENICYFSSNATYYGREGVWSRASKMFANGAHGSVFVLLQPAENGRGSGIYQAFRNTSIFGQTEFPNINPKNVTDFTIMVLRNTTLAPNEVCGSGTLLTLHQLVQQRFNFTPTCIDDPQRIYDLLCPKGTQVSGQCLAATLVYNYEMQKSSNYRDWAIAVTVVAAVLFLVVIILAIRLATRKGYDSIKELDRK